jgi:hypothetical protein
VTANLGAQVIVDNKLEARGMYVQLTLKGKMFVADAEFDNRTFVILPKAISMPTFKILNKDGEEQFLE